MACPHTVKIINKGGKVDTQNGVIYCKPGGRVTFVLDSDQDDVSAMITQDQVWANGSSAFSDLGATFHVPITQAKTGTIADAYFLPKIYKYEVVMKTGTIDPVIIIEPTYSLLVLILSVAIVSVFATLGVLRLFRSKG